MSGNSVNLFHVKREGWEFCGNINFDELHYVRGVISAFGVSKGSSPSRFRLYRNVAMVTMLVQLLLFPLEYSEWHLDDNDDAIVLKRGNCGA
jgi:hypothetical protein